MVRKISHKKNETFMLNRSRENYVPPRTFQTDICNYRLLSVLKIYFSYPNLRVEYVHYWIGPISFRLLELSPDLFPAGGGQYRDLLPGHGLTACHGRQGWQGGHIWQRFFARGCRVTNSLNNYIYYSIKGGSVNINIIFKL